MNEKVFRYLKISSIMHCLWDSLLDNLSHFDTFACELWGNRHVKIFYEQIESLYFHLIMYSANKKSDIINVDNHDHLCANNMFE